MPRKRSVLYCSFAVVGGVAIIFPLAMVRRGFVPGRQAIVANTFVGHVPVGGLTREEAAKQIRVWWETEKRKPLALKSAKLANLPPLTASQLGVGIDDAATVAGLPLENLGGQLARVVGASQDERHEVSPVYKSTGQKPTLLVDYVKEKAGTPRPARALWVKGGIALSGEISGLKLDEKAVPEAVIKSLSEARTEVEIPIVEAPKKVPDDQLRTIREVITSYTTHFPASNRPRTANLRAAAKQIDGVIIMPGDTFSFNNIVGERTVERGFREAVVYVNGQHEPGIGGGICQVCSTLYNAVLFADLKIVRRANHSLPVPYVPLGRDATVSFGSLDFVWRNTYPTPVAVCSQFGKGTLTFRLLGQKRTGLSVKVYQQALGSKPLVTKTVEDPELPLGKKRIVQKGTGMRMVATFRNVFQDGVLVRQDKLGRSTYGGQPTIIAVGTKQPPPVSTPEE